MELTRPLTIEKAKDISQELGSSGEFTLSWLEGFKNRHNIRFNKPHGESRSADFTATENWLRDVDHRVIAGYKADDIFNADETDRG